MRQSLKLLALARKGSVLDARALMVGDAGVEVPFVEALDIPSDWSRYSTFKAHEYFGAVTQLILRLNCIPIYQYIL